MKNNMIILASSSPRRIDMLKKNNIYPIIMPPSVDETLPAPMTKEQAVMYLALKKALSVEKTWLSESRCTSDTPVIIAADTIVFKNEIIGKPIDFDDAVHILESLRNTNHFVVTGVAIIHVNTNRRLVFHEITEVFFNDYSDDDIRNYISTGEPWDKAGGYAIQSDWGKHISHIVGDYDNVVGFPWTRIKHELNIK